MSIQSSARSLPTDLFAVPANDASSTAPMPLSLLGEPLIGIRSLSRLPEIACARRPVMPAIVRRTMVAMGRCAAQVVRALLEWQRHAHARRFLLSLDDRMLRDLGLSRHDIQRL